MHALLAEPISSRASASKTQTITARRRLYLGDAKSRLRLSRFTHVVACDDGFVGLFNALNLAVVGLRKSVADRLLAHTVVSTETLQCLCEQSDALLPELERQGILVSIEHNENHELATAREHLNHTPIGILYLLLTDACNLRCQYCYIEAAIPPEYQTSKMNAQVARNSIDLFARALRRSHSSIEEPQIIFYGGEPFLNWDTMLVALGYIREQVAAAVIPDNTGVTINTNGTLVTEEMARALKRFPFVTVAVSVDGPPEVHDGMRLDLIGRGSYERTDAGIRRLQAAGVNVGLCCTLTANNLHRAEEILLWLRQTYDISALGFNLLIANKGTFASSGEYAEQVAEAVIRTFRVGRREGIYEDRMMRKVRSFVKGKINFYDCGGCGGQLVIAPDGQVGVCQAYCGTRQYFTDVAPGFDPFEHEYWKEWRQRSPISMEQCEGCIALGNCGGGCAYAAHAMHGNIRALDDNFCTFSKKAIEFLVRDLIASMHCQPGQPNV